MKGTISPEKRLVGTCQCVHGVDVVEEAKIVDDLKDGDGNCQDESGEEDPRHPLTRPWFEGRRGRSEEGSDLDPCNDVMGEIGPIQRSRRGREIPSVALEIHETERSVQHCQQKLGQEVSKWLK